MANKDERESSRSSRAIIWMGDSLARLREFPDEVKDSMGQDLFEIQSGGMPSNIKSLASVGSGVYELREDFDTDTYRCVYIAKMKKGIYVLHAFKKKSKSGISTPRMEVDRIRERYKQALKLDKE